jgi:hypothetical protein
VASGLAPACLATALLGGAPGPQVLELGGDTVPPALERPTRAQVLTAELEEEIAERITREPEASSLQRLVLRASVNVRVIAADLLTVGDESEGGGSEAVLAGLTLADGRDAIDGLLQELVDRRAVGAGEQATLDAARDALRQFNEDAVRRAESIRTADPVRLDRGVPAILSSLAEAVIALGGVDAVSHWPAAARVAATGPAAGDPDGDGAEPAVLRARLAGSTLPAETATLLEEILDYLDRAEPFADLRAIAAGYRRTVARVLRLEDGLVAAAWLPAETAASFRRRLHRALVLFRDPSTRDRGQRRLDELDASRRTMERITELATGRRVDINAVQEAFLALDGLSSRAGDSETTVDQLAMLDRVVDRMIEFRRMPPLATGQRLQAVYRQLERRYRDAEEALLEELRTISLDDSALADPAFASLLNDHRRSLDDLRRVQLVPGWVDTVSLISPPSARRFTGTARQWCERLLDQSRRPETVALMAAFEGELRSYYPLPFERELRAGSGPAVQATGGFNEPLVAVLDSRRRAWIDAWAAGAVDDGTARSMRLAARLTRLMEDTAPIFRLGGDATVLNAWAAWELPPGSLTRVLSELPSRVKLAVASVIEGNDDALERQLGQIAESAPVAQLLGRLSGRLEPVLDGLPVGAASTIGQLLHPPPSDAWLILHRRAFADLCRYAVEESHARSRGNLELAQRIAAYVNRRSERLLETLDADAP